MGIFSSIFKKNLKFTKFKTASEVASIIDLMVQTNQASVLFDGSILLDSSFQVKFAHGTPIKQQGILAIVNISLLENSELLKTLKDIDLTDSSLLAPYIDNMAKSIVKQFCGQCPAFNALDYGGPFDD